MYLTSYLEFPSPNKSKTGKQQQDPEIKTESQEDKNSDKPRSPYKAKQKHDVCFMLPNYCWAWSLPWSVVDIPIGIALAKIDLPFPIRYQLQRPLWLGVGLWVHSPLSMLRCCLVASVQVLCMLLQCLGVHVNVSPLVFWKALPPSSPLPLSSLSHGSLSLEGSIVTEISFARLSAPKSNFLYIVQL